MSQIDGLVPCQALLKLGYRMSFVIARLLWPDLLVRQIQRLYSIGGQGCKFASLSGQAHNIASTASMASGIIANQALAGWSHWLSPADGQSYWLGSMLQCSCKQGGEFPTIPGPVAISPAPYANSI